MKGGIFFTGSGPIVVITSHESFMAASFIAKLAAKGLKKFVAYEVPLQLLKDTYGRRYDEIMYAPHQRDEVRILDYDGHRIFYNFTLSSLGEPVYYEP